MSSGEIIFILFIVVIVFGADKIPEIARGLGKGIRQLRDATNEIKHEIQKSAEKQLDEKATKEITKDINKVIENFDDVTNSIKRQ